MPELIDMKRAESKKKDTSEVAPFGEHPDYPYGLRLHLGDDDLKKLAVLQDVKFGDTVTISATGKISELSMREADGGKDRTMEIQIRRLGIGVDEDREFAAGFESEKE